MNVYEATWFAARGFSDEHLAKRIAALEEDPIDLGGLGALRAMHEERDRRTNRRKTMDGGEQSFEDWVKELGFESEKEFHHMVSSVRLTQLGDMEAFKRWQHEDGTKTGLAKLPARVP